MWQGVVVKGFISKANIEIYSLDESELLNKLFGENQLLGEGKSNNNGEFNITCGIEIILD